MKIFSIIVTYNGMRWYDRCLGSLRNSELPVETIVIDNASSDDSVNYIKANFPEVHLIESNENLGFAKANNIGIRRAYDYDADYIFLLNQDAWIEKNTISCLITTFKDNPKTGIAAPIHLNGSYTGLDHRFINYLGPQFASDAYMHTLRTYYEVPFVNAAAWLINRCCIETVGGFDTSLFRHYGEDRNYCQRMHYHRFRIIVTTQCTICHDREERNIVDNKYISFTAQTPFFEERKYYGDINNEINFPQEFHNLKKKKILKLLRGKFSSLKNINAKIECLHLIEKSRKKNMEKGQTWL